MRQCDEYYYEGEGQEGRRVREWFCASPHAAARSRSRPPAALSIALSMLSAASARVRPAVLVVVWRLLCTRAFAPQPARPAQPQQPRGVRANGCAHAVVEAKRADGGTAQVCAAAP